MSDAGESEMTDRQSHNRRTSDLPDDLYDMPDQAPANLLFLLGQVVSRLAAQVSPR